MTTWIKISSEEYDNLRWRVRRAEERAAHARSRLSKMEDELRGLVPYMVGLNEGDEEGVLTFNDSTFEMREIRFMVAPVLLAGGEAGEKVADLICHQVRGLIRSGERHWSGAESLRLALPGREPVTLRRLIKTERREA